MNKSNQLILVIVVISLFVAYKYFTDKNTYTSNNSKSSCPTVEPPSFDCSMCSAPQMNGPTVQPSVTQSVLSNLSPSVTPYSS